MAFVTLAADGLTTNFKFTPDRQELKYAVAPDVFAPIPDGWARQDWTGATLAALDEAELVAALDMAWRQAAPRPKNRASLRRWLNAWIGRRANIAKTA